MVNLVQSFAWCQTPLGPMSAWPQSLHAIVTMLLHSRHPMFLWWGPDLIQIYNDAYVPCFGKGKHPAALGQRGAECWQEIWHIISPQIDDVMKHARSSWNEDQLVPIFRNGRIEDVYWTYGYSPVFDESGGVGGTLVVCTETTSRVLATRRSRVLRALAERTAFARHVADVIDSAMHVLETAKEDVSFVLVFKWDAASQSATVEKTGGLAGVSTAAINGVLNEWLRTLTKDANGDFPASAVIDIDGMAPLSDAGAEHNPKEAYVARLLSSGGRGGRHMLFGISPRLPFDEPFKDFLLEFTGHISQAKVRIGAFADVEFERNNLLSQAPVATAVLTGPDHVYRLANARYCEVVGRQDLIGKPFRQVFPELVDSALPSVLDRVYETGTPYVANEYLISINRPGRGVEDRYFTFNLEPVRDAARHVYGMMVVAVDITDQVRARQVLEAAHTEREKLLTELEAAIRSKDEFLAMLGHELRNPLSPMVTAVEVMKLRGDSSTKKEQRVIERQITHLIRLVDDLLDVSKITRGKIQLTKERVEFASVLARAVEIASPLFEHKQHRLTLDVPREPIMWEGDPVRLAQVVENLLTNAARYTKPGGQVVLRAQRRDDRVIVSVKDNGIGIRPELLPSIFDLFVQGQRSADRAEGGLGLGLAIVKNIVALHGGTATATSRGPGQGSEFIIELPLSAPIEASLLKRHHLPAIPGRHIGKGKRVLVVDDNTDAAALIGEVLRATGHNVRVANDPVTALSMLEHFTPEVAILDIGLPVIDGYELAAQIRSRPHGQDCRIVALTGYGQENDQAKSKAAGFAAHLVKPVGSEQLLGALCAD